MQIPTFTPEEYSTDEELKSQWFAYGHQYFNPNHNTDTKTVIRSALDYNLSQINTQLNNPNLELWTNVLLVSRGNYPPATFFGGYLRQFYEKSDKSANNFQLTRMFLANKASNAERIDFLREIADNHKTYEQFYGYQNYNISTLMPTVFNSLTSSVTDRPRAEYLIGFVFSPRFLAETHQYVNKHIVDMIFYLDTRIEFLFENIFKDDQTKINFLVSSLYILDRSKETVLNFKHLDVKDIHKDDDRVVPELYERITTFFEKTYPELYKQYNVMKSLELGLSLSEVATNLIVCIEEPSQPSLSIEF